MSKSEEHRHDSEVIELEPTVHLDVAPEWRAGASATHQPGVKVGIAEAGLHSLTLETETLRRKRLAATSLLLACVYAVLLAWNFSTLSDDLRNVWILGAGRFLLSAATAAILFSPLVLSARKVRVMEFTLFGGLTALMIIAQYFINLALIRQNDVPGMVAFVKNGVIQMFALMMLYGTFIPNDPKIVMRVVLTMAFAPLLCVAFMLEHPHAFHLSAQFGSVEHAGSNAIYLLIGAGMAIYGAYLLNGLRTELHEARKFGQYQLVRKLGEGGMGEVYLAEHQLLKRPCALKLIRTASGEGADALARARFEREVRSAARLSHPNTIEVFDYGHTDDGTFYYVMEYLQGLSLAELIREEGPLPPGRVIYLFRQICGALSEAHGLGLVHRDLKPANMFIAVRGGESDVAKVLDFGLVKLTREPDAVELTRDMTVSGTPLYMAPEQAMAERSVDARADVYALGAMLYFALTAQPPFSGDSPFSIMMAHARDPVVPPSEIRAGIPADLEQVVLQCLAKKAVDRFPDVKALGRALAACASAADWDSERADQWWGHRHRASAASVPHELAGLV